MMLQPQPPDHGDSPPSLEESPERVMRRSVINIRRLLHCMETNEAPMSMSWEALLSRADMARALWHDVQEGWNATADARENMDEGLRQQDEEAWIELQTQVDRACRRAQEIAHVKRQEETDWVDIIFLQPETSDDESSADGYEEETKSQDEVKEKDFSNDNVPQEEEQVRHHSYGLQPSATRTDVEELQKAQREQLEREIAHMAEQLKNSTKSMHNTLRNQAEDLDEMEGLATENVQKVTKVAGDVTDHVKKQWRSTIATWTMIFTILCTFSFCFLTIRMVPKRSNACIFFCPKKEKVWKEDGRYCLRTEDGNILCEEKKKAIHEEPAVTETCNVDVNGDCIVDYSEASESKDTANIEPDHFDQHDTESNDAPDTSYNVVDAGDTDAGDEALRDSETVMSNNHDHLDTPADNIDRVETTAGTCGEDWECRFDSESANVESDESSIPAAEESVVDEAEPLETFYCQGGECNSDQETQEQETTESEDSVGLDESHAEDHRENGSSSNADDVDRDDMEGMETPTDDYHEEVAEEFIVDFDAKDVRRAAAQNNLDKVRRLLRMKPELARVADKNGWQAIHEASRLGHTEIVRLLIDEFGVDVNARTGRDGPHGGSVLWWAYKYGLHDDHEVVRLLKEAGAISLGPGEELPSNYNESQEHVDASMKEMEETADAPDFTSENAREAAYHGNLDRLAYYLSKGKWWLNEPDSNGWCAIHEAVRNGQFEAVQLLVESGCDLNARIGQNRDRQTPLAMAVKMHGENHPISTFLRNHGIVHIK